MYLKELELVGFKSFLNKTTLHFEPGITAIVGPNGCGKSNIFDSIRWVLGEQSIKSLRGSDMQDVIFNGTDSKEPLSLAEVSLAFDNSDSFFNVDHNEVVITRRIFRSGESEYLLNKSLVRLKDILDLLMGTGIGAESYSLVAQGQIDLILSSKPEDRRLVFDEASGITKYKTQKKEAMRKLEETEQNLLRINDIITEVKRQIGSLERQANKARRYKEVFEELKTKEINLAVFHKQGLLAQKDRLIKQLADLEGKEEGLLNEIKEQESKISSRQSELKALEDEIMGIKNEILNLDNALVRNRERIAFNEEKTRELEVNLEHLESQALQSKNKLLVDEEKLKKLKDEHLGIQKGIEEKMQFLKKNEGELVNLASSIKCSLDNISQAKKEILDLVSKIANAKNEVGDLTAKQQIYLARKRRLELEKAKVNEEKAVAEDNLKNITQELVTLDKVISDAQVKMSCLKDELERESTLAKSLDSEIEKIEKDILTLNSHKDFIKELKTKYEDIGESMNAVIYLDKLPREHINGLVVKIKERVNLSDEDKAYLEPANFKLAGEAKPIDLDTQKLEARLAVMEKEVVKLKDARMSHKGRTEELNARILDGEQEIHKLELERANKKSAHSSALEQFKKIKEEEDIIILELSDVEKEISILEEKLFTLKDAQVQLETLHKQKEELMTSEQNSIASNSNLKEGVLVIITQTKTEIESLIKRVNSEEATLKILEETYGQDRDYLSNIEKQICEAQNKKDSLGLEIVQLKEGIDNTGRFIEERRVQLKEKESEYRKITETASDVVAKIEADRKELDVIKNELYELQMQNKDIDFKFLSLKERILQGYKVDLEAIDESPYTVLLTSDGEQRQIDEGALTQEIHRLKEKLDSYGTVNLVAIEEYDELKTRYDFLLKQHNDLTTAKESLHEAILKINRTTKKMFLETFERVREEFRGYFRLLFNGGDAQIFLVDEQDPLESGIEIICRPPGKKLQNVLLLSGGEKSLSAIALIFAIFKVKPAPFCILDEIDAALDEANVDRFNRLLQEFIKISQFIVITHNKRTIANANVMYGITMEESGVSKIVSVKFAQAKSDKDKDPDAKQPTLV
jgi:chromosome segregation protein